MKPRPWQRHFADHTTRVAFNLTLSRRMVEVLHIARDCDNQLSLPMLVRGTVLNLERRGLIEFHLADKAPECRYRLTPAGVLTVQLLVLAGLIPKEKTIPRLMGAA